MEAMGGYDGGLGFGRRSRVEKRFQAERPSSAGIVDAEASDRGASIGYVGCKMLLIDLILAQKLELIAILAFDDASSGTGNRSDG